MSKTLHFSINQMIVDGATFGLDIFNNLITEGETIDSEEMHGETPEAGVEVIKVKKSVITQQENRFVKCYFLQGDKFPYTDTVMNQSLHEEANPRPSDKIEMDEQFFFLIDCRTQKIYASDQRKRNTFGGWLREQIGKDVIVKSIIDEQQFLEKLKSVKEISLTVVPNILNSGGASPLGPALAQDILGFEAARARLKLEYEDVGITRNVRNKIGEIFQNRDSFEDIVVVGHSDDSFESIYNMQEVVSKVDITVEEDPQSKLVNVDVVFSQLIDRIKTHEH